jgi:myosin protein heavy chain
MISSLESTKERLEGDLDRSTAKISQLESKLKIHEQLAVSEGGSVGSEGSLQGRLADLTVANEALQRKLTEMENEKSRLGSSMEDFLGSKRSLEEVNQVSIDTIQTLQKMISQLESAKEALENEMHEATDAIGMLEDELDRKDVQVKELLVKLTQQQQLFSQVDKCKTALAERNAKLSSENDDLNTQVKVLIIEKKVASEEIETLKTMKIIANEDEEEELLSRQEQRQEVDNLINQLEIERAKNNERVSTLEQQVYTLEEGKRKLEEELDESSDAIAVLREALTEMQDGSSSRGGGSGEGEIEELQATTLREKEELMDVESSQAQIEDENRANVETIAALRNKINRLESTKEDLQEEFTTSTLELVDLKEQMKKKGTVSW